MRTRHRILIGAVVATAVVAAIAGAASQGNFSVLDSRGSVAHQQRELFGWVLALMLLVVVPVFALTAHIVWRYRATNHRATYTPEWDHNHRLEALWWGFPTVIILILSVMIWQTSHSLDPYRAIAASPQGRPPITVQVVALQWKWLFIYPEQRIASVNHVVFPENTPVKFEITADAPMNSFWIPQLGGQVYAMSGMRTNLHLMADEPGNYRGVSANLSGEGFADMNFEASSLSSQDFETWVQQIRKGGNSLDLSAYYDLREPATSGRVYYGSTIDNLQATIVSEYASRTDGKPGDAGGQHAKQGEHKD